MYNRPSYEELEELFTDQRARERYLANPAHANDGFWLPSPIDHEIDFGFLSTSRFFRLIDPFSGKRPWYVNAAHSDGHHVVYALAYYLVLDCDCAEHLAEFLEGSMKSTDLLYDECRRLVEWISLAQINVYPAAAFIEQLTKTRDEAKARMHLQRLNLALLRLATMDGPHYRATGEVRASEDVRRARMAFETSDLDEASRRLLDFARPSPDVMVGYYHCSLLKVALIEAKFKRYNARTRVQEFVRFVEDESGRCSAHELAAAFLHFTGRLERFLSVQRGMQFDRVIEKIESAAWDVRYMSWPEQLLGMLNPPSVALCFTLTCDRSAALLRSATRFHAALRHSEVFSVAFRPDWPMADPTSCSYEEQHEVIGELEALRQRFPMGRFPYTDAETLKKELHDELRRFLEE